MIHVLLFMALGGVITSAAEYKFSYNLFDYILDGIKYVKGLFAKKSS